MSDFYAKLGSKTLAELPIPTTNIVWSGGTGAIAATWQNNNTISDCINVLEYWNGSQWLSGATAASGATSASFSGLGELTPYNVRISVKQLSTGYYYPSLVSEVTTTDSPYPLTGLIGRFTFESDATDSSGNGNDLTPYGSTATYPAGKVGNAIFGSGSEYSLYEAGALKAAVSGTNNYTISFWTYNDNAYGSMNGVFGCTDIYEDGRGFPWGGAEIGIKWQSSKFYIYRGGEYTVTSTLTVNALTWYHWVITFDGSATRLYQNTTLRGTHNNSYNITSPLNYFLPVGENVYSVRVDQMYIYDRVLDTAEIAKLYNSGSGI